MVEFGVNILQTAEWTPGNHLHVDRGRMIQPKNLDTLPAGTTQGYVKLAPAGGVDGWEYAFAGTPGNVNGDATSPFSASPSDYNVVNFQPAAPILQSGVSCVIKPVGAPAQTWRQEFLDLLPTFRAGIRVMDLCATQGDHRTARDPASAGSWSGLRRLCPRTFEGDGTEELLWQSNDSWGLDDLLALDEAVSEIHICVPPVLLEQEDKSELITWLSAWAARSFTHVWVELSNECWNQTLGNAPYARLLRQRVLRDGLGNPDVYRDGNAWIYLGQAEAYAQKVLELADICAGISPKLQPIIAWQSTHLDPWIEDIWRGNRPHNDVCYNALDQIGHIFVAPYFQEPTQASVDEAVLRMTTWRAHVDRRGVVVHGYEGGMEFGPQHAISVQTEPATLVLWDSYLRQMAAVMAPQARFYLYGLASEWRPGSAFGLRQDIAVTNAKWDQVAATIDAIKLVAPLLP